MNRFAFGLLIAVVVGYGLFEARRIIQGPVITILTPINGSATSTNALSITGRAENISFLTIEDKPAYTDGAGNFAVTLSPPPGLAVITVAARDRFGRSASRSVFITVLNYCPAPEVRTT